MATKAKKKAASKAGKSTKAKEKAVHLYGLWLSQPSQRVALMLNMAKVPYAYHHVDLMQGAHKQPDYLKLNRFGQVPAVVYRGEAICQSNRILEFLAGKLGKFDGRSPGEKRAVREWLSWADDRLSNVNRARAQIRFQKGSPEVVAFCQANARAALDTLEGHMKGRKFIVGAKPTVADISAYAQVALLDEAQLNVADWPSVAEWCARMSKLPGAGHPYDSMPKESRA